MNQYALLKAILRDKNDNSLFFKGKWSYTDVTPVSQLLKIADLIKPFYAAETVLLERMVYKNKNQHQRARYYKRVQQILKRIRAVDISELIVWIKETFPSSEDAINTNTTPHPRWQHDALYVLYKLYGLILYLTELNEYILSAYDMFAYQLEQTYFMALSLAFITCLARFYNLHHKLMLHLTQLYDLVVTRVTDDHDTLLTRESDLMTRVKLYRQLIGPLPSSLHVTMNTVQKKKKKKKQFDQLLTRVTQSTASEAETRQVKETAVNELHKSLRTLTHDDEDMGESVVTAGTSFSEPPFSESVSPPGRGVKRKREDDHIDEVPEENNHAHTAPNSTNQTPRTDKADVVVKKKKPKHNTAPIATPLPVSPSHTTKPIKSKPPQATTPATPPRPLPVKAQIPPKDVNSIFASLLSGKKKKK